MKMIVLVVREIKSRKMKIEKRRGGAGVVGKREGISEKKEKEKKQEKEEKEEE